MRCINLQQTVAHERVAKLEFRCLTFSQFTGWRFSLTV